MGSADEEYRVLVTYTSGGDIEGAVKGAHGHAHNLKSVLSEATEPAREIGAELIHGFQHAVEHAAHLVAHMAKVGLAAGVAGAAYGVGHLNNELEQTQISLAAIFKANAFAGSYDNAFVMAGDQVKKMKQDIKTLPGDLGQLSNVMLQLASPLANAGKDPDAIRRMAGKTMLASQILLGAKYGDAAQEIGAREMAMLLQGNFGSKNSWAMEMPGMTQYKAGWKQMSEEQRLKIIEEKMNALVTDAGGRFATSLIANWTTLKDNFKYGIIATATEPLTGAVKNTMARINTWFDENPQKVKAFTDKLGNELVYAWHRGEQIAEEWWPKILEFAHSLRTELEVIWDKFAPTIKEAALALKTSLGDGTMVEHIKGALQLYAATKIGGSAAGLAGGGLRAGASISQIVGSGALGTEGLLAGGVALGVLSAAAIGAAGELHALTDATSKHHEEAKLAASEFQGALGRFTDQFNRDVMPAIDAFGVKMTQAAAWMIDPNSIDWASFIDPSRSEKDKQAQEVFITNWEDLDNSIGANAFRTGGFRDPEALNLYNYGGTIGKSINDQLKDLYAERAKKGAGHGAGGTHVQKVEIVVNTNQDANRVAEFVVKKIEGINRHPKVSGLVPNYSGR